MGINVDQKGGTLAGSRLRLTPGIGAVQNLGKDLSLDRRAVLKAQVKNAVHNFLWEIQIVESCLTFALEDGKLTHIPWGSWFAAGSVSGTRRLPFFDRMSDRIFAS
jgi:hypothetical protein